MRTLSMLSIACLSVEKNRFTSSLSGYMLYPFWFSGFMYSAQRFLSSWIICIWSKPISSARLTAGVTSSVESISSAQFFSRASDTCFLAK